MNILRGSQNHSWVPVVSHHPEGNFEDVTFMDPHSLLTGPTSLDHPPALKLGFDNNFSGLSQNQKDISQRHLDHQLRSLFSIHFTPKTSNSVFASFSRMRSIGP